MNNSSRNPASATSHALGREVALVESAIEMVANGYASRMQLGGLAFGNALLEHARRMGAARRVRVTPQWGLGEQGLALVFEPAEPGLEATDA